MDIFNRKDLIQVGILTDDIHRAAAHWAALLGVEVPPVTVTERYEITGAVYRGRPCLGRIHQAILPLGSTTVELIAPCGGEPSVWRDCLDRDGPGLHHLAFAAPDLDAALREFAAAGLTPVQTGSWPAPDGSVGGRYAYLDARDTLHCWIELLQF